MNPLLLQKESALATKRAEIKKFLDGIPPDVVPTKEQNTALKGMNDACTEIANEINLIASTEAIREGNEEALKSHRVPDSPLPQASENGDIPQYNGHLKNFKGANGRRDAYNFGMWMRAAFSNDEDAKSYCAAKGIKITQNGVKAMTGGLNSSLGSLIPEQFIPTLIVLREEYGVARKLLEVVNMTSETAIEPRRVSGLTAYMLSTTGVTASTMAFDNVKLTAKEIGVLAKYKNAAAADSVINLGDRFMGEMAYAFSYYEDNNVFNGDGTSTYDHFLGISQKLLSLSGTIANIAGLQVASGHLFSQFTLTDFDKTIARLPQYADTTATSWVMHRTLYYNTCLPLLTNLGGVTLLEGANGQRTPFFRGYPVVISQVMPKADANSQVAALIGDYSKGGMLGDRQETTIVPNTQGDTAFVQNETWLRAIERIDINIHDVGNASATASLQVAGPIVGLISAAS